MHALLERRGVSLGRARLLCAAVVSAALTVACSSRDGAAPSVDTGATAVGSPARDVSAAQPTPGRIIDVQMIGDAAGYRFVPATVTIKVGDTVRWTNVSGGPHNVTFWSDSMPAGAAARLQTSMPQATAPLTAALLTTPHATYMISFAGVPAGTFVYYCTPHLAFGMTAKIVVAR